jgi:AcrR family transcriptional regulator
VAKRGSGAPATDAQLTVSALAERSGLPASTIRYYLREGLLPQGRRLSRTRTIYDSRHLEALERIKNQRQSGLSISELRSQVEHVIDTPSDAALAEARRDDILTAATACFLRSGFAGTSLAAIAQEAAMSTATLYGYFSSKEAIFMACAERIFHQLYADVWPAISRAKVPEERLRARWNAFVKSFAVWASMMNLVRGLAVGDPAFRREYLRLVDLIVAPIARELAAFTAASRGDDADFLAYVAMGISEAGSRAVNEGRVNAGAAWNDLESILKSWATDRRPPTEAKKRGKR